MVTVAPVSSSHKRRKAFKSPKETALLVLLVGFAIFWVAVALLVVGHGDDVWSTTTTTSIEQLLGGDDRIDKRAEIQNEPRGAGTQTSLEDGAPPVIGKRLVIKNKDRETEVVVARPIGASTTETTFTATALLLHGCSHSALKFFSPSPEDCPTCIGLSEELRIARLLVLAQQYIGNLRVIAVTSQNRQNGCWSNTDVPHIQDVLNYFHTTTNNNGNTQTQTIPIYAFGASSGGRFAAQLAVQGIVNGALVGVMSLGDALVQKWNAMLPHPPPIYLAPMPRDQHTLRGNERDYAAMKDHGPVVLDTTTCQSFPVTVDYLHERVPHMTYSMAQQIVPALIKTGHLDPATQLLVKDPTKSDWRIVLQQECQAQGCLQNQPLGPGVSPLAKALHRAWAFHEYCSEVTIQALQFFQKYSIIHKEIRK